MADCSTRLRVLLPVSALVAVGTLLEIRLESSDHAASDAMRRLPAPATRVLDGFRNAACVDVSSGVRVCKAQPPGHDLEIVLIASGRVLSSWPSGFPVFAGTFDVRLGDLDADGADELLITDHVGTSNGMAVTYHRSIIVSSYDTERRSAIAFDLQEFCGECDRGTYVPQSGRPGVAILVTEWMWGVSSIDPRRVPGNYVVGRWFTYDRGRLRPRPGVFARRYLHSFADERGTTPEAPASWFTGVHGRALTRDPAAGDGRVIRTQEGAIELHGRAQDVEDYTLRLRDGQLLRVGTDSLPLDGVGLVESSTVLPKGVAPEIVIGEVTRRRARLDEYRDGDRIRRVLWIQ